MHQVVILPTLVVIGSHDICTFLRYAYQCLPMPTIFYYTYYYYILNYQYIIFLGSQVVMVGIKIIWAAWPE